MKPEILKRFEQGEGLDYLEGVYETIDLPKHEEYIKNEQEEN